MSEEFPKMLLKVGGTEEIWGQRVATIIVADRGEQTDAEADGFQTSDDFNGIKPEAPVEGKYDKTTVADLKALAAERGVDLGDATKRADVVAALELADEAEAKAPAPEAAPEAPADAG